MLLEHFKVKDYEKYDKNSVSVKYDEGENSIDSDKFYANYMKMLKQLPTKDADDMKKQQRDDIKNLLTDQQYSHKEFGDNYWKWKTSEDHDFPEEEEFEREQRFLNDPETHSKNYYGRLSPYAKENVYRDYLQGTSVKDLSLKYGILQQRVKAIVFQKHLYWNEIYPKLGETHMRLALEREYMYAKEFPFVEYGLDLGIMGELEKGVKIESLSRTEYDSNPPADVKNKVNAYMEKMRCRKSDRIPIEF